MASDGVGTIYISGEDWFAFLAKYSPAPEGAEIRFSAPALRGGDIEVKYAFSTENDPETWVDAPEWLKDKR